MAIHPIDLSTMYSQLENVSKFNASQNQLAQVLNQNSNKIESQHEFEKIQTVKETEKNAEDGKINPDAKNSQQFAEGENSASEEKNQNQESKAKNEFVVKNPRIGRIIDITG